MTQHRSRDEKLQQQLRQAGAQWKESDLDEIMALLEKDYTDTGYQNKTSQKAIPDQIQWDIPADTPVEPVKEKKVKKEKPVKEKKPLTEKQQKLVNAGTLAGLSVAILAETAVIVYMVVQWVQWL